MKAFKFNNFSRLAAGSLSFLQIILGLGCIGLQACGVYYGVISTHLGCSGIWGGFFIVFAGVAGFVAAKLRSAGAIASYMVLNALATLIAPAIVVTSTISVMEQNDACTRDTNLCPPETKEIWMILQTIDIALIIVALVDYCISCSALVVTCWTLYCDPAGYVGDDRILKKSHGSDRDDSFVEMTDVEIGEEVRGYDQASNDSSKNISAIIEEELSIPESGQVEIQHHYENKAFIDEALDDGKRKSSADLYENQDVIDAAIDDDYVNVKRNSGIEESDSPRNSGAFSSSIGTSDEVPRASGNYAHTLGESDLGLLTEVEPA